jgi:superfamily II DNA helicase RecQ
VSSEESPAQPTVIIGTSKELRNPEFLKALEPPNSLPTIVSWKDEVHVVQAWSFGFKASAGKFGALICASLNKWPGGRCPMLAMTATATRPVREWIMRALTFRAEKDVYVKSLSRPNVSWSLIVDESLNSTGGGNKLRLDHVIKAVAGGNVVVIFVNTQAEARNLTALITTKMYTTFNSDGDENQFTGRAAAYHSEVPFVEQDELRAEMTRNAKRAYSLRAAGQKLADDLIVLVCTLSFGMSISIDYLSHVIIWPLVNCCRVCDCVPTPKRLLAAKLLPRPPDGDKGGRPSGGDGGRSRFILWS